MKLLKMHDNADGKFDQFVKEQLDKTDVDMALADTYFVQMQWPAAAQAAPKRRRRWIFIWFAIGSLVAITAYLFTPTDKKAPAALPNRPMFSQPSTPAMASDGDTATTTGPAAKQSTVIAKPIDNNLINKTLTIDRAAIKQTALSVDTVEHSIAKKLEHPIIINDTVRMSTAKRDTVKLLRTAVVPPKAKDSVYIVW